MICVLLIPIVLAEIYFNDILIVVYIECFYLIKWLWLLTLWTRSSFSFVICTWWGHELKTLLVEWCFTISAEGKHGWRNATMPILFLGFKRNLLIMKGHEITTLRTALQRWVVAWRAPDWSSQEPRYDLWVASKWLFLPFRIMMNANNSTSDDRCGRKWALLSPVVMRWIKQLAAIDETTGKLILLHK